MRIEIDLARQRLRLLDGMEVVAEYPVSTATRGAGELHGSECTPRGRHQICACIGKGCAENTVFCGRHPTGEIYAPALANMQPGQDWILTRILWLEGLEAGKNRYGEVDTRRRFIYIHGAPDEVPMGIPGSHGCIRMRNGDVLALFAQVRAGDKVLIRE